MIKYRMSTKNLMVSFVTIAMALFLVATVSASGFSSVRVDVDDITAYSDWIERSVSVLAGDTIIIEVEFDSDVDASEVIIKAELDDEIVKTSKFDVEKDVRYTKFLKINVPYDFDDDELSKEMELEITIEGEGEEGNEVEYALDDDEIILNVQRHPYNVAFKSINVDQNIEVGETFPVDIVLKNDGYNDLDDLYITARIPALGIEKSFYFGDLVTGYTESESDDDDDTDTISKRFELTVPYDAVAGSYAIEVEVSNDDTTISKTGTIEVVNSFPEKVIRSGNDLILVNPTNTIVGYRIVPETPASVSDGIVFVRAGSTETVTVTPNAKGEYTFDVVVFTMDGNVIQSFTFTGSEETSPLANPIVIITVILAIIFLVLLVVLIVLVTKKPEKTEEFGESYY